MLQIIKKDYKDLDSAIRDINSISINYDYFKDYDIISNTIKGTYTALLKFDVPKNYECFSTLDIAKLKPQGSFHVLDFYYKIEFDDEELESQTIFKDIRCKVYNDEIVEIQGDFGFKDFINFVEIRYMDKEFIEVKLNEFYWSNYGLNSCNPHKKNKFVCENIDCNIIYNHIINVYLQRGYLFASPGLKDLYKVIKMVCGLINERKLKHEKLQL